MPPRFGVSSAVAGSANRSAAAAPVTSPRHNPIADPVAVSYSLDGGSPPVELSKGLRTLWTVTNGLQCPKAGVLPPFIAPEPLMD